MKNNSVEDSDLLIILDHFNKENFYEAEKHAKIFLSKEPENLFCLKILGIIYSKLEKTDKALNIYKKLTLNKKNDPELFNNLGIIYKKLNRLEESLTAFTNAINLAPNYSDAYYNLSNILEKKGLKNECLRANKRAVELDSNNPEVYSQFGIRLYNSNLLDESTSAFQKCIELEPDHAKHYFNLAKILDELGESKEAIINYKKAIQLDPHYYQAHTNLGNIFCDQGIFNNAQKHFEKAISINPNTGNSHYFLSLIKKYQKEDDIQLIQMEKGYLDEKNDNENRCAFAFGLGKAYEDLGSFKNAYHYYCKGNALRKKQIKYDYPKMIDFFDLIKSSFTKIKKYAFTLEDIKIEKIPVFIVGMPRSGTTLVEQILSSHTEVMAGGELKYISELGVNIINEIDNFNEESLMKFRESYLDKINKISNKNKLITDKMPQNFLYIGLITSAFPEAKIIHLKRDSSATCWGIFKKCFSIEADSLAFGYSLDDIVKYYKLYIKLIQFFRDSLSNDIYELDYESLVENIEIETKNLIHYLNLHWEESCLSPHKNSREVMTSSKFQVRKKIYKGSSKDWQKFQPFLNGTLDNIDK
jgi:tetratricopeptide (TPR) repeat protein